MVFIVSGSISRAQTATFKFSPPLDKVRVERETRNITTEYPGKNSPTQLDEESSITEVRASKRGDEFLWVEQHKKISRMIDGKPFDNPMNKVLMAVAITNLISKDGRMVRSLGNERIVQEARKIFPPEAYPDMESQLNVRLLDEMAMSRWNDTYGSIIGRTVKQGDVWRPRTEGDEGANSSIIHFKTSFPSVVSTPSNTVVTVLMFGCNDLKALDHGLDEAQDLDSEAVKSFLDKGTAGAHGVRICLKRVLDANTMAMISEEEIQKEVNQSPQGRQTVFERTQRNYSYVEPRSVTTKPDPETRIPKTSKTIL